MKTVKLVYFARLREALGVSEENIEIGDSVNDIATLTRWLRERGENWAKALDSKSAVRAAVNLDMAQPNTKIADKDEVAFFPPVTGG